VTLSGDAVATAKTDSNGDIVELIFTSLGTSYQANETVTVTEDNGSGEGSFTVTSLAPQGAPLGIPDIYGGLSLSFNNADGFSAGLDGTIAEIEPNYGRVAVNLSTVDPNSRTSPMITFTSGGSANFYYVGQEITITDPQVETIKGVLTVTKLL